MEYPIMNAVRGRTRQAMSMALGTASDVASRGMGTVRAYGLECRPNIMGLAEPRPATAPPRGGSRGPPPRRLIPRRVIPTRGLGIMGLGVSSQLASAGQEGMYRTF